MKFTSCVTTALLTTAIVSTSFTARADSWAAPRAQRHVDVNGDRHVIVDAEGGFVYARRADRSEPVTAKVDQENVRDESHIPVRDGDVVLARGKLPDKPLAVLVSADGHGFVALDRHGRMGRGKIVIIVDATGATTHALQLREVFPNTPTSEFRRSVSSIWWRRGGWIDEPSRSAVIVGTNGVARVLDLNTGKSRGVEAEELRRALQHRGVAARALALELVAAAGTPGVETVVAGLVADEDEHIGVRLRAAIVLGKRGDRRGWSAFERAITLPLADGITGADYRFALENMAGFLGDDALPVLREMAADPARRGSATLAAGAAGEEAVPLLLELLAGPPTEPDYRSSAASALKRIGSRDALPGLLAAIADEHAGTANAAANAAIAIGGDDCAEALTAHLARGCTQDGRIAMFFKRREYKPAIPALIEALSRATKEFDRRREVEALKFQTGEGFGADAGAWRTWWTSRER